MKMFTIRAEEEGETHRFAVYMGEDKEINIKVDGAADPPLSYWSVYIQSNFTHKHGHQILVAQDRVQLRELVSPNGDHLYHSDLFALEIFHTVVGGAVARVSVLEKEEVDV